MIRWLLLGVVLGVGLAVLLIPTSTTPEVIIEEPEVVVEEQQQQQREGNDELFLEVVREYAPAVADVPGDLLITAAHEACNLLDEGYERSDLSRIARESGMSPEVHGTILGAGVAAYCPEYYERVME